MKKTLFALAVLFALLTALAPTALAAGNEYRWEHYGIEKFALTREEAMAARDKVFRESFKFSGACYAMAMQVTRDSAVAGHINVGDLLDVMVSKGFKAHANTRVAFKEIQKGVTPSANAEFWEFDCDGKRHKVALPAICFNWSLYPPTPVPMAVAPPSPVVTPPPAPALVTGCPNGWRVNIYAWRYSLLPAEMQRRVKTLIRAAEARKSYNASRAEAYSADAVSRTLGAELRKLGTDGDLGDGPKVRAEAEIVAQISYRDPQQVQVVRSLAAVRVVNGRGSMLLPGNPRAAITEAVFAGDPLSPVESGGARRLWVMPAEWKDECEMAMHSIVP